MVKGFDMTKEEMRKLLSSILAQESKQLDIPTESDWIRLSKECSSIFPDDFIFFIELMAEFKFPGDILNVTSEGKTNGNDTIALIYEKEFGCSNVASQGLIPFYSLGNGDYFCLSSRFGKHSPVYFFDHSDQSIFEDKPSFKDWVQALPVFLEP